MRSHAISAEIADEISAEIADEISGDLSSTAARWAGYFFVSNKQRQRAARFGFQPKGEGAET